MTKAGIKKQLITGLIITIPAYIIIFLAANILQFVCQLFYELLWKNIYPNLSWPVYGPLTIILLAVIAYVPGYIYYRKSWFRNFIDSTVQKIPIVKYFWQMEQKIDFSKFKAARITVSPGIEAEIFLISRENTKNNHSQSESEKTSALYPNLPIPFTGFMVSVSEKILSEQRKIRYIKTDVTKLLIKYISFGIIQPQIEFEEENYFEKERRGKN